MLHVKMIGTKFVVFHVFFSSYDDIRRYLLGLIRSKIKIIILISLS